jgi:carbonic anhydrase
MMPVEIAYRCDAEDERGRPTDPDAALRRLATGNRDFAELFARPQGPQATRRRVIPISGHDLGLMGAVATPQRPYAAVLGCADARVPIELIFGEGPNDLFVVRVAGNTLGDDVRGSLKYALAHLSESLRLVVVLGHSGCGAVTAAVDVFLDPAGYFELSSQHSIRTLVDRLQIVVQACAQRLEALHGPAVARHPRYREALIEAAVVTNAALAAHTLQQEIGAEVGSGVRTAYGVYVIDQRTVWAPRCGSAEVIGLAPPPEDAQAFREFSAAVLGSARIAALIAPCSPGPDGADAGDPRCARDAQA